MDGKDFVLLVILEGLAAGADTAEIKLLQAPFLPIELVNTGDHV